MSEPIEAPPRAEPRVRRADVFLVLGLALVARLVLLHWALELELAGDEKYYWGYYETLVKGDVDDAVTRPPLWGWIVAGLHWLFGDPSAARVFTALVGAATAPLVYALAVRVFDRRTALVAGVLYACYPELLGYSHYLWAETFFGFLAVSAVYLFFRFFTANERTGFLVAGSLVAGLSLITKAFGAIVFLALLVTLVLQGPPGARRRVRCAAIAVAAFLLPVTLYSLGASAAAGRTVVLSETGVLSARQAAGIDPAGRTLYDPEQQDEKREELLAALARRSFGEWLSSARRQFAKLWTPNSFVSVRLLETQRRWWRYPLDNREATPIAVVVTTCYVFLIVAGLAGLCLGDGSRFKTFSIACLILLSAASLLVFLTSRYRVSFSFVFLVHAGHLIAHPRRLFARLVRPWRAVPLFALLAVFAWVVLTKRHSVGLWG